MKRNLVNASLSNANSDLSGENVWETPPAGGLDLDLQTSRDEGLGLVGCAWGTWVRVRRPVLATVHEYTYSVDLSIASTRSMTRRV